MATNSYVPNGLTVGGARQRAGGSASYQNSIFKIKAGYSGSNIGRGDLVKRGTGAQQGYIVPALTTDTNIVGVFDTVLLYYDKTAQQTMHGLNGSYQTNANPSADILCTVIDDPFVTFVAQVNGGPYLQAWEGQNINFLTGTNGVPDITGQSVLALDGASVGTANTLPFQILSVTGVTGGPRDPANTNPWIEVRMNLASMLQQTGI